MPVTRALTFFSESVAVSRVAFFVALSRTTTSVSSTRVDIIAESVTPLHGAPSKITMSYFDFRAKIKSRFLFDASNSLGFGGNTPRGITLRFLI